ncbi:hypothetical protein NFO65_26635 [Neorhizobium galegae]|uniref:DUF7256 domain-containing protein n=1 Tax=Neorhizobium galegae TaxID=399 RepID=UPI002100E4EE|nr:hypothetical protein [Neorhizobium galegae]MCQ1574308.1 hypothetical protein [Neorhizobium galegae]MCQ1837688.1 hypothetical protein [Neorhizobium galegae]
MAALNDNVDVAALAALRPGMPMTKVEAAMGSAWKSPAPHKGGKIDLLENSHGVVAWIDRDGLIGMLNYNHRFLHPVSGIAMEMKIEQVRAAMPSLEIGDDLPMMRGVRIGVRRFPEGYTLRVRLTLETVNEIVFSNPEAEYPEPTEPPYPAAAGITGAPFADANLKLVVLSSLLDAKQIDLGSPEQLATHVLGRAVNLEDEGYEIIPEARDYLERYPLTDERLAAVEEIEFDGGGTVYEYAWYFWDGEDDVFDVKDLSGIELCRNLKSFSAISMIGEVDVRTFLPFPKLESLHLSTGMNHIEALLDLPALKEVRLLNDEIYKEVTTAGTPTRRIFQTLKDRGVRVWVHWVSATEPTPHAFE